jgi:hypothetical protein
MRRKEIDEYTEQALRNRHSMEVISNYSRTELSDGTTVIEWDQNTTNNLHWFGLLTFGIANIALAASGTCSVHHHSMEFRTETGEMMITYLRRMKQQEEHLHHLEVARAGAPAGDININGDVHGQNQQFNAGGGNQQNNKTVKTAMIEYDNNLLNNPGLLSAGSQVYGIKKTLDAVLRFDDRMISEIVQNNDEDLLLAGILSFEDYAD